MKVALFLFFVSCFFNLNLIQSHIIFYSNCDVNATYIADYAKQVKLLLDDYGNEFCF